MNKYDPLSSCPKCGNGTGNPTGANSIYAEGVYATATWESGPLGCSILRRCKVCGYTWDELPLDAVTSEKKVPIQDDIQKTCRHPKWVRLKGRLYCVQCAKQFTEDMCDHRAGHLGGANDVPSYCTACGKIDLKDTVLPLTYKGDRSEMGKAR